jgi:polyisoprenoid-binding protein YceI
MSKSSAGSGSRLVVASVTLLGLAACQTSPPAAKTPPPAQSVEQSPEIPAGAHAYKVTAEQSLLQILVYRGGAMARLGHNHVIASHQLAGSVYATSDLTQSRFDITVPVNELSVDEPAMREQAGADFPPGVPQSARDGTRSNLLSEALLDGAKFPAIRLRATEVVAAGDVFDVDVEITLKDQVRHVRVPMQVRRADGAITASGEFPLKQSELGLKPFSAAMGALLVVDEMRVRFDVTARDAD